jgi:hypothetical protein
MNCSTLTFRVPFDDAMPGAPRRFCEEGRSSTGDLFVGDLSLQGEPLSAKVPMLQGVPILAAIAGEGARL